MQQVLRCRGRPRAYPQFISFGVGSSRITALDMKHKLMRIGLRGDAVSNNHFVCTCGYAIKTDVAMGVSHSAHRQKRNAFTRLARRAGATTIAITHNLGSPLCEGDFCPRSMVIGKNIYQGDDRYESRATFVFDLLCPSWPRRNRPRKQITDNECLRTRRSIPFTYRRHFLLSIVCWTFMNNKAISRALKVNISCAWSVR